MKKYGNLIFSAIILLAALGVRSYFISRDLEYDEIWSLENYSVLPVSQIFSDLATPNNHPVNSLLIKWLYCGKENCWQIRIGSLLFSLGSVWLLYLLGAALYRKKGKWYAAAAGAFLPSLIVAGTTARGYAGQLFFLLLFGYALIKCRKGSLGYTVMAAVSGMLAIVALPSSILYIIPPGIFFTLYLIKKRRFLPGHLIVFGAVFLIASWWYITNYQAFAQSRQFKVVITGRQELYQWFDSALALNGIWWIALPIVFCLRRKEKMSWILLTIILFPLLAALFTSPAPARVYLPGAAAGILLFAPALKLKKYQFPAMAAFLAMQIAVAFPVLPDTRIMDEMTAYKEVQGIITVYGANESYPVAWNHPELIELHFRQIHKASEMDYCALMLAESRLSGVDDSGNTVIWDLPPSAGDFSQKNSPGTIWLKRTTVLPADTIAFAIYPPMDEKLHRNNIRYLDARELIYLNGWLTVPLKAPDGSTHRYALIAFKLDKGRIFPPQVPIFTFAIEK